MNAPATAEGLAKPTAGIAVSNRSRLVRRVHIFTGLFLTMDDDVRVHAAILRSSFLQAMRRQIPGKEWPASGGCKNACRCTAFPIGRILSLPIVAALAIRLFVGTTTALAAETENASRKVAGGFAYPVSTANRRFIDQTARSIS